MGGGEGVGLAYPAGFPSFVITSLFTQSNGAGPGRTPRSATERIIAWEQAQVGVQVRTEAQARVQRSHVHSFLAAGSLCSSSLARVTQW